MKSKIFINLKIMLFFFIFPLFVISCKEQPKDNTEVKTVEKAPFFKLSLAQWSLHKAIIDKTLDPIDFAQKAKELGFEGLEYVSQLYSKQIETLGMEALMDSLKGKSEQYGVKNILIMVDNEGDLATPNEQKRNQAVKNHIKWIDAAAFLGCHSIRVNLFGSNEADVWSKTSVDGLKQLSEYAKSKNINVIVENHGYLSSNAELLSKVITDVDMDNCGTLPDFGNFCLKREGGERWGAPCIEEYDKYKGVEILMKQAKAVSAKSYDFDENGNETTIDYTKMLQIVKDAGYTGFIGVEYEGNRLNEEEGILATKKLLLKVARQLN